jgi:probable rRNA maturation factor
MTEPDPTVLVDVDPPFEQQVDVGSVGQSVREAVKAADAEGGIIDVLPGDGSMPWGRAEVGVRITDDAEMHRLNREYRGVDRPTDVLSFSFIEEHDGPQLHLTPDMPLQLGEIAVSYPYVVRQAEELGHPDRMELAWLVIHGTLQLLGYTHDTEDDAQRMEGLERVALRALGFDVE